MTITVEDICRILHISETTLVNALAAVNSTEPVDTTDYSVYYVNNTAELAEAVRKGDKPIMPLFRISDPEQN